MRTIIDLNCLFLFPNLLVSQIETYMKNIITLLFIIGLLSSVTAQKRVLMEKFTTANCGSCPNAALLIKDFQDQYPGTIWVSHHKPTTWMDYPLQNDQSNLLWGDLTILGQPWGMVDRAPIATNIVHSVPKWTDLMAQQAVQPYYANLAIQNVTYDIENRTFDFGIEVNFEELPDAGAFRVTAIILEDSVVGPPQNNYFNDNEGHPLFGLGHPIPNYVHRNVARTILDHHWGTSGVVPNNPEVGLPYVQEYSYTVPEEYDVAQIKVVAVLSYYDEATVVNRQVLNATETRLSDVVEISTSTNDLISETDLARVFPNPASTILEVQFSALPDQLFLLDSQGRQLKSWAPSSLNTVISTNSLTNGLYLLQVQYGDKLVTKKVVITK